MRENLPDRCPYKIDEERFKEIWTMDLLGSIEDAIQEYNSTLPEGLKPLPKEMPDEFEAETKYNHCDDLWDWVYKHYGTPESNLKPLPSVEELSEEIWIKSNVKYSICKPLAQHLHSKYGTQPREWWKELNEGDLVRFQGMKFTVQKVATCVVTENGPYLLVENCTPYTEPTAEEIIAKHNLTEEEVKIIKES